MFSSIMGIISIQKILKFCRKLKKLKKSIVLVGGCFDVLHPGHVIFLEKAKAAGDILIVLLESDQKVKQLKGINRPVHSQMERAQVLSALRSVDHIVILPFIYSENDYDQIVKIVRPDVIAATRGGSSHHQRSAKLVGAKIRYVTKIIGTHSSSRILNISSS